jgi:DeoR/GlpR family transcriptional regulator of sugar metabolism
MSTPVTKPARGSSRNILILRHLQQHGSVTVEELSAKLAVSPITIRRDLDRLESQGALRRTHGGAIPIEPLFYEAFRDDSSFQEQIDRNISEKRRIALAAAELIEEGDTIGLTSGTTAMLVVRNIPSGTRVTVVTNTVNVAMELSKRKDIDVFVTGGHLRGNWFSLVGPAAQHAASQIFLDKVFIGVNGIDVERGCTCYNPDEAGIDGVLVRQARKKIVVADHTKLGVVTTSLICPLSAIDILITDVKAPDGVIAPFIAKGIDVRRV